MIQRMVRIYDKLHRAVNALEWFTTHEWKFSNNNVLQLIDQLNGVDREVCFSHYIKIPLILCLNFEPKLLKSCNTISN